MFDVGFTEIILIGVVALVVIGPERLPDVARNVGRYVGKLQRFVTGVKRDIRQELETGELKKLIGDQKEQLDELRRTVDTTRREVDAGVRELRKDTGKTLAGLEKATEGEPGGVAMPDMKPAPEEGAAEPGAALGDGSGGAGGGAAGDAPARSTESRS